MKNKRRTKRFKKIKIKISTLNISYSHENKVSSYPLMMLKLASKTNDNPILAEEKNWHYKEYLLCYQSFNIFKV